MSGLRKKLIGALAFLAVLAAGSGFAQPIATGSFLESPDAFLGTSVTVSASFANTGDATGYGPYLDVTVPNGSSLEFTGATYLGANLTYEELPVPASGMVQHPYHGPITGLTHGDTILVIGLPFGSSIPGQPAVEVDLDFDLSPAAPLSPAQQLGIQGGYRYGKDPLDNPGTDEPIRTAVTSPGSVQPLLVVVDKNVLAPDHDTPIGPTFRHTFEITVDIAPGQTMSDLEIIDHLPQSLVYIADSLSVTFTEGNPVMYEYEFVHGPGTDCAPQLPTDDVGPCRDTDLVVQIRDNLSVDEASPEPGRVTVRFDFYLSLVDAQGRPTGAHQTEQGENTAEVDGLWTRNGTALSDLGLPADTLVGEDKLVQQ